MKHCFFSSGRRGRVTTHRFFLKRKGPAPNLALVARPSRLLAVEESGPWSPTRARCRLAGAVHISASAHPMAAEIDAYQRELKTGPWKRHPLPPCASLCFDTPDGCRNRRLPKRTEDRSLDAASSATLCAHLLCIPDSCQHGRLSARTEDWTLQATSSSTLCASLLRLPDLTIEDRNIEATYYSAVGASLLLLAR